MVVLVETVILLGVFACLGEELGQIVSSKTVLIIYIMCVLMRDSVCVCLLLRRVGV